MAEPGEAAELEPVDDPRRVLMLCYHFPPRQNGGVERSRQFARLLPGCGWSPVVLTVGRLGEPRADHDSGNIVVRSPQLNRGTLRSVLGRQRPDGPRVDSTPSSRRGTRPRTLRRDLLEHFLLPDPEITWALPAVLAGMRTIKREGIDVLYSTSPPESSHVLGLLLARRTGLPWVMDLRDPWSFESLKKPVRTLRLRRCLESVMERACFARASRIIVNTPEMAATYRERCPQIASKLTVIPNGVDLDELARARATVTSPPAWTPPPDGALLFAHTGTFCRLGWHDMSLAPLLDALVRLRDVGALCANRVRFVLAGDIGPGVRGGILERGLETLFEMPGMLTHEEALRLHLAADRLLLYDPPDDGVTYVRGKLYEYLVAGKPIVGIVPDGATRSLLASVGHEMLAPPDDGDAIERVLRRALDRGYAPPRGTDVLRFDRRRRATELATELNLAAGFQSITGHSHPNVAAVTTA